MRDVKKYFSSYQETKNWKHTLEAAIRHENRSLSQFLGCSPSFALNKKFPLTLIDYYFGVDECSPIEIEKSNDTKLKYRQAMKKSFDARNCKKMPKVFVGSWILVQTGYQGKHSIVRGPFKVSKIIQHCGIIKDLLYIEDGKEKIANMVNIALYHHRSDVHFKWGSVKGPVLYINIC